MDNSSFYVGLYITFLTMLHNVPAAHVQFCKSIQGLTKTCFKRYRGSLLFQQFVSLTLTTSSSVERHLTASETSVTEASIPMVTTFTGTATVFPVRTAVFKISESYRERKGVREGWAHQWSEVWQASNPPDNNQYRASTEIIEKVTLKLT